MKAVGQALVLLRLAIISMFVAGLLDSAHDFVTKAERFDTVGNKWEEIANMQQKRWNAFGVASEGKIFCSRRG